MRRIDGVTGNRHDDPELAQRIERHERNGTLEQVVLDLSDRKKSRLRVETDAGTDLGIVVDQPELRSGDVLFVDEDAAAVVTFRRRDAYVVELPTPSEEALGDAVELGHRVGNQHWDVAIENGTVYIPVEADEHILEDVVDPYLPTGARTRYEEVEATMFIESKTGGPEHDHEHGHGPDHEHGHEHNQDGSPHAHDHSHE